MKRGFVAVLCAALFLIPSMAGAQSTGAVTLPPGGNLQNPGARALALGGAVVGLADDASASELNPAGIAQIPRDEISIEYRQHRNVLDNRYRDSSVRSGSTAFAGDNFECLYGGPGAGGTCGSTASRWARGVAFASAVVHTNYGLALGLYRHEIDRERLSFVASSLDVPSDRTDPNSQLTQFAGAVVDFDRQIDRTGLAIGWRLGKSFSIGASVNENSLSSSYRYVSEYQFTGTSDETFLENGRQKKLGYTAGVLFIPAPVFQIGAAYTSRVRFRLNSTVPFCVNFDDNGFPTCAGIRQPGYSFTDTSFYQLDAFNSEFVVPAKYGIGVAFRPPRLNIVAEADRARYSDNNETFNFNDTGATGTTRLKSKSDDVWELRAGVEWLPFVSPSGFALALRAGFFHDPDHLQRTACQHINQSGEVESCGLSGDYYAARSLPKHSTNHITGGVGIVWSWGQVDLGYDRASRLHEDTFSVSLVIRP